MIRKLKVSVLNNFRLYLRSRVLLLISIVLGVLLLIYFIPLVVSMSTSSRFNTIVEIVSFFNSLCSFYILSLFLIGIHSPMRDRSIKLIFTKPLLPEYWLLSNFASSLLVAVLLNFLVFLIAVLALYLWSIPMQIGLVYILANNFFNLVVLLSFVLFVSMLINPVAAAILTLTFSDDFFYYLGSFIVGMKEVIEQRWLALLADAIHYSFELVYFIIPISDLYSKEKGEIYQSLRVSGADWDNLVFTFVYAVVIFIFYFLLSSLLLKRKRLI